MLKTLAYRELLAVCLIAPMLLVACGDGGSEGGRDTDSESSSGICRQTSIENCGPGPWDPFGLALSLAWISGQCTKEVLCTTDPVVTSFDDGIVTEDFIEEHWTSSHAVETEPNDSPSEATPFVIQANTGVRVRGSVNDSTDVADFVAISFGPNASVNGYFIYICGTPDDCLQPWYLGDEIYVDLMDQNELVLQTTKLSQSGYISFLASPGVLHFVAVRASNTNGMDFDYSLVVTD